MKNVVLLQKALSMQDAKIPFESPMDGKANQDFFLLVCSGTTLPFLPRETTIKSKNKEP